jgi:hypothetical protein
LREKDELKAYERSVNMQRRNLQYSDEEIFGNGETREPAQGGDFEVKEQQLY